MPEEYKDYGYWNVPYFLKKASAVDPDTRSLIDGVIRKYSYLVQSFRSCFGILKFAERYSREALERCCHDALLAGKCNYSYVANTIATYHTVPKKMPDQPSLDNPKSASPASGIYKDDDSSYSLKNLLKRQEEGHHEEY